MLTNTNDRQWKSLSRKTSIPKIGVFKLYFKRVLFAVNFEDGGLNCH